MKNNNQKTIGLACCLTFSLLLSACVSRDITAVESEVSQIMARKGGRIEPVPEIKLYEAYIYSSGEQDARDPFKLFYVVAKPEATDNGAADNGLTEEMKRERDNRNREELEQFELDSLRMVGTIDNDNNNWAIVLDPEGVVHRISVGNYMGTNIGKVINVFEDRIELREIFQDGTGRWAEREATLALIEE